VVRDFGPAVWRTACRLLGSGADAADGNRRRREPRGVRIELKVPEGYKVTEQPAEK
jgi:hypothetical protein